MHAAGWPSKDTSRERGSDVDSIRGGVGLLRVTLSTNQRTIALLPSRPPSGRPSQNLWEGVFHCKPQAGFPKTPSRERRVGCVSIRGEGVGLYE